MRWMALFTRMSASRLGMFVACLAPAAGACSSTLYVSESGSGNCLSWQTACDLKSALATAQDGDQLWIGQGHYFPSATDDRSQSFVITRAISLHGGFAGDETGPMQRDPAAHPSILSGDIGQDDANADGNGVDESFVDANGGNSYSVVRLEQSGNAGAVILDGLTITGGDGHDGPAQTSLGGGIQCLDSASRACSLELRNVRLLGNQSNAGGGLAIRTSAASTIILENAVLAGNRAWQDGGAVYLQTLLGTSASIRVASSLMSDNVAILRGAGIYLQSRDSSAIDARVNTSSFLRNACNSYGSGISAHVDDSSILALSLANSTLVENHSGSGGAGLAYDNYTDGSGQLSVANSTFSGNDSYEGGALYKEDIGSAATSMSIVNTLFWNDHALGQGSEIFKEDAHPMSITYSIVEGGADGISSWDDSALQFELYPGNASADPRLGGVAYHGGATPTMLPGADGAAIDLAYDGACNASPVNAVDQRGRTRPQGAHCDIGAVELATGDDPVFANGFE